ncbi:MAG: DNA polymerase/3'-5' exonuclease PolX [Syntrophus sp. PtaU1.Bin208]|nr:MAG: DNA polymerase/3'-5' exonuclease PolX [Syntrophus sp. PtaU1.Bin208]
MIDLHTHSFHSDGELIPSELARRALVVGYRAMAITDHGDHSNVHLILPGIVAVCKKLSEAYGIPILPGIELTHVPPIYIRELAEDAREKGAKIIVVHGETLVEPVMEGTNRAALSAPIDILAHPGLIGEEESLLAARNSICLEITTRKGHSLSNGHVAAMARKYHAPLVLNTDTHESGNLTSRQMAEKVARGAGMTTEEILAMFRNSENLVKKAMDAI